MIYTCTLNPSIDYFVSVDQLKMGETNRITKETKAPGGKGINVSRVLQGLGIESRALGFLGGFSGKYIEDELSKENIVTDFIKVEDDTRINIKLRTNTETEINGQGPIISDDAESQFFDKIQQIEPGSTVVLAGSIPSSMPEDFYKQITQILTKRDVKVVVDTTKQQLVDVLPYKPFLIKPNHHELADIFQTSIASVEDVIPYGEKLVEMGAQIAIVSMAAKGTLLFTNGEAFYANIPEGKLVNSVGAGDSVVAGFIASYTRNPDIKNAFHYAAAAGSATAYSQGFCTSELINELLPKINITTV